MNDKLKIPTIGEYVRNIGTLVKIETVQPPIPAPYKEYIFEDIEAKCELRLGEEVLNEIETLCDFYGLGTGLQTAIDEMKDYAKRRGLNKNSEVEVVVIKVISQYRKKIIDTPNYSAKEYVNFDYVYRNTRDLPEPIKQVVWSSKSLEPGNK
jgi:hypothetical protein